MKVLIDTCGWIEWLTDGKLIKSFAPYFSRLEKIVVPTLVQYELYKWICREKNAAVGLEFIGMTERAVVIPLETHLALHAAELSQQHELAMADAIIYATCLHHHATLITSDKHFKNLPQVTFFEKNQNK